MRSGHYILGLFAVVLVLLGGSYFARQYRSAKISASPSPSPQEMILVTPTPQAVSPAATQPAQLQGKSFILENPTINVKKAPPKVSYDASMSNEDKLAISQKVVEPYIFYQEEIDGTQVLQSIDVTKNTQASAANYPYLFSAQFEEGAKQDFALERKGTSFQWFVPECLTACPFSDNFKAKYPEIVTLSEQK